MTIAGFFLSVIGSAIVATWVVAGIESRVSTALIARIELAEERDSKGRHDQANAFDRAITEMRQNLRDTDSRHAALDRDAIRKADLSSVESRIIATMAGIETRITAAVAQIEARREADLEKLERRIAAAVRQGREDSV